MKDADIDALWIQHRDAGDVRAFARAVADAAFELAAMTAEDHTPEKIDRSRPLAAHVTGKRISLAIRKLRSER